MFERVNYLNGEIPRSQFTRYKIPVVSDIPSPQIVFFEENAKSPVKGIGELSCSCVPAALMNALSQAAGFPLTGIPVSLEDKMFAKEEAP
jgi:CO/xanthine dehydrogenase Mo-binding subunit